MTDAVRALVRQLHAARSRWRPDPRAGVLAELGQIGGPDALASLLRPIAEGGTVGRAAASAAGQILGRVPAADLAALELRLRGKAWWVEDATGWSDLTPGRLDRRAPSGWLRTPYFGLASMHWDGHVREAAVRALAREPGAGSLPFVVLRLNDWVAEVRAVAEAAVWAWLESAPVEAWARALPLVVGLEARERHRMPGLLGRVVRRLTTEPGALEAAFQAPDRTVRRAVYRVALGAGGEAARDAAARAPADADLLVRLEAARALRAGTVEAPGAEAALARDSAQAVRREVLLGHVERDDGAEDALLEALLDPSPGLRAEARFFLDQRTEGGFEAAPTYRAALRTAPDTATLRTALDGLGETGGPADADLLTPHLADARPTVQAAALRALVALDPTRAAPAVRTALLAPAPRLARTAVRLAVSGRVPGLEAAAVVADALGRSGPARLEALRRAEAVPLWSRLPLLIRAATDSDDRFAARAADALEGALGRAGRVFTTPTDGEAAAIRDALEAAPAAFVEAHDVGALSRRVPGLDV